MPGASQNRGTAAEQYGLTAGHAVIQFAENSSFSQVFSYIFLLCKGAATPEPEQNSAFADFIGIRNGDGILSFLGSCKKV
ncbi:MAG: hypothetical protein ACI4PD_04460 [Butyricicoccus sp.]